MILITFIQILAILATAYGIFWLRGSDYPIYYQPLWIALVATIDAILILASNQSKPRRRIVRENDHDKRSHIIYDSEQVVCQLGGWKWTQEQFCQHWFINGPTGVGKTTSGLNALLVSLTSNYPIWGGLILDPKGLYWRTIETMVKAVERPQDLAVLKVQATPHPSLDRFNLIGDPSVPEATYAQMIVDAHSAHAAGSGGGSSGFFQDRALEHITKVLQLMRLLAKPFNLVTAYTLLTNKKLLAETLTQGAKFQPGSLEAMRFAELNHHFQIFYLGLKASSQAEGEIATIANFLAPYQAPAIASVFCSTLPDTVKITDVDGGKKICLSVTTEYDRERKYIYAILKLLFYQHAERRFDLKTSDEKAFWRKNLLVLVGEEFQEIVTSSEKGKSDYKISGMIREARLALIILTQSYVSLFPPHASRDQANVLVLNLRNRLIFRAADEECAKQSADFIGKHAIVTKSKSIGRQGASVNLQDREEYKLKPHEIREFPNFTACVVHCARYGRYRRVALKHLTGAEAKLTERAKKLYGQSTQQSNDMSAKNRTEKSKI
jgi:hypothetical protein